MDRSPQAPDRSELPMPALPKAPTGISGLDEVTGGGLPQGRPTLLCGPAGCGKTLLATEFIVRGITEFGDPGVFVAFEESAEDLVANVASLGFDLAQFEADGRLVIDHVKVASMDMEDRRLGSRRAVPAPGHRDRPDWRQAGRDRHDRELVRRVH